MKYNIWKMLVSFTHLYTTQLLWEIFFINLFIIIITKCHSDYESSLQKFKEVINILLLDNVKKRNTKTWTIYINSTLKLHLAVYYNLLHWLIVYLFLKSFQKCIMNFKFFGIFIFIDEQGNIINELINESNEA